MDDGLPLERVFTPREVRIVETMRTLCAQDPSIWGALVECLDSGLRSLSAIVVALESYPSLREPSTLAGVSRSVETLFQTLQQGGEHGLEWALPAKAILARAFGIAKVHFWTSLQYVVRTRRTAGCSNDVELLWQTIDAAIEEAVYTRLAEELYGAFLTSRIASPELKRCALDHVVDVWEGRTRFATDQFCPTLRSAWAARMRSPRRFGTLLGVSEIANLFFRDCDPRFVEAFTARDAEPALLQAFEEFLFDLPFESLERVRARMAEDQKSCVTREEVARYLGLEALRPMLDGPKELYSSFRRRRVKAQYRMSVQAPGPKRTAEAFVLESLLRAELAADRGAPRSKAHRAQAGSQGVIPIDAG